jgi:hypothetical protein
MNEEFERDPRRQQELRCRPYADEVYRKLFGKDIDIKRFECEDNYLLDKTFAMDVQITLTSGMILTGQEKFLSQKYASYETVTIEDLQNPATGEHGDWFKMAVQFYFTGYENCKGFNPWILLNWPAVALATERNKVIWYSNRNKDGHARASFKCAKMKSFPADCIIGKSE